MDINKSKKYGILKKVATVIAMAFYPALFIGAVIASQFLGSRAEQIWIYFSCAMGFCSFMVLCCLEIKKLGETSKIGPIKTVALFFVYATVSLPVLCLELGSEIDGRHGMMLGMIIWICMGVIGILGFLIGGIPSSKEKAAQYRCDYQGYEEWEKDFLQKAEKLHGYTIYKKTQNINLQFTFCIQRLMFNTINCISITKTHELTDEFVDLVNEEITDALKEYCKTETPNAYVNMISVFCVERVSPAFYKLVNSSSQQGIKNGRLIVGISFGGKQVYIAKHNGGAFPGKYNDLKKRFLDISGLNESHLLKK